MTGAVRSMLTSGQSRVLPHVATPTTAIVKALMLTVPFPADPLNGRVYIFEQL